MFSLLEYVALRFLRPLVRFALDHPAIALGVLAAFGTMLVLFLTLEFSGQAKVVNGMPAPAEPARASGPNIWLLALLAFAASAGAAAVILPMTGH